MTTSLPSARRAAPPIVPGIYLAKFPFLPKLDLRVEGVSTDTSTLTSVNGTFNYYESIQKQGYTNKGFIMGDWIGREAKGGQAWLTWHLSGNEWVQLEYLNKKTPKDFIPGGTTTRTSSRSKSSSACTRTSSWTRGCSTRPGRPQSTCPPPAAPTTTTPPSPRRLPGTPSSAPCRD